jgi:hypothetical protein
MEDLVKKWGAVAIQVDAEARIAYWSPTTETLTRLLASIVVGCKYEDEEDLIQPLQISSGYRHAAVECIRSIGTTGHVFSLVNPLRVSKVKILAYDPVTHPYDLVCLHCEL